MRSPSFFHAVLAAAAFAPAIAGAQRPTRIPDVPQRYLPPPGMCRIWVEGVPADKQPAPTDCASALRNRPGNGHVVFSESKAAPRSALERPPVTRPGLPQAGFMPLTPSRATAADSAKARKDSSKSRPDTVRKRPPPRGG